MAEIANDEVASYLAITKRFSPHQVLYIG